MKNLQEYIEESLLDNTDTLSKNTDKAIKQEIKQFIKDNFKGASKISKNPNDDGKYVVDCNGKVAVKNKSITSLTNDLFVWGKVGKGFDCSFCTSLTSLEGAPKEVGGGFNCSGCDSLTSLKDAPKEVGGDFNCCSCKTQFFIDDVKKVSKVKGEINCWS